MLFSLTWPRRMRSHVMARGALVAGSFVRPFLSCHLYELLVFMLE